MTMIRCSQCGGIVPSRSKVCAHCGADEAAVMRQHTGFIVIHRKSAVAGSLYELTVHIDNRRLARLKANQTVRLVVPPGEHILRMAGGRFSKAVVVEVGRGQELTFVTRFSNRGFQGGGLTLDRLETASPMQ